MWTNFKTLDLNKWACENFVCSVEKWLIATQKYVYQIKVSWRQSLKAKNNKINWAGNFEEDI